MWRIPRLCPVCKAPPVRDEWRDWVCLDHGPVLMSICVACDQQYEESMVDGVPYHCHRCDPREGASEHVRPIDHGKTLGDKLRDAELMGGAE